MIEKEIWVYFLAYNLIRLLMAQAALLADILRQLSFKHTLQLWFAWSQQSAFDNAESNEEALFVLIAQRQTGNRLGRIEPRKAKAKTIFLIDETQGRSESAEQKNGYPKKRK